MKKRILSLLLIAALFISGGTCALAAPAVTVKECDYSLLNTDESKLLQLGILRSVAEDELRRRGYSENEFTNFDSSDVTFCGSLSEAQTILSVGSADSASVYYSVAQALSVMDSTLTAPAITWDQDEAPLVQEVLKPAMSDDFLFQLSSSEEELKGQMDAALEEMKSDGTLQQLTEKWVKGFDPSATVNLEAAADAKPLRLAVTGDLPPFDFTAEDGSPSGFALAVLAEIGSRIGRSIVPVSVLPANRQYAVTHSVADVALWALPSAGNLADIELKDSLPELSQKEGETVFAIQDLIRQGYANIPLPGGTIATAPFYSDFAVTLMKADTREKIEYMRAGKPVPGLPVILASPISLTVREGESCTFKSNYSDAIFAVWHFVSPSGRVDVEYDNMQGAYPETLITDGMYKDMTLENVTMDYNGWKVYCRFSNDKGYMDTDWALITVVSPDTILPPEEQKQITAPMTVYDDYGDTATIYETQIGWYDTAGGSYIKVDSSSFRSSAGTLYYTRDPNA